MSAYINLSSLQVTLDTRTVIEGLDLSIAQGEFVSIVGPYGCGKTTLLKVLAGLIDNYQGNIMIENKTPRELRKLGGVGYCFQRPTLLPWLNVDANLRLPAKLRGSNVRIDVPSLLRMVHLEHLQKEPVTSLSGGTQQLISILRSLSLNPKILLLDEPFSSIDEINREQLQKELLNIHKQTKKTTVLVTHSISEAVLLSDVIVVLSSRPAKIKKIIKIQLQNREVNHRSHGFNKYVNEVREALGA